MNHTEIESFAISARSSTSTQYGKILMGDSVTIELPTEPHLYLYHGWQSWSLAAWIETSIRVETQRPVILHPMQIDPVYVNHPLPHGSWYGGVIVVPEELRRGENGDREKMEKIIFLGALGLDAHVELRDNHLHGWYESGEGEWFSGIGNEIVLMNRYADLLEERFGKAPILKTTNGKSKKSPRVWCSWYSLYTEINQDRLLKILADLGNLPFEVFQVDDGWEKSIGDWEANEKFPNGMSVIAEQIKTSGRTAGLWLAPLLVVPSSGVYQQHREWLLRDEHGQLVSAGFNWSEPLYAIDTTHPEALEWLAELLKSVRSWGYDYLKLDFLYAGALPGVRHIDMPRETAFRYGLQVMREAMGEAYFLGCGVPILPSLGICDGLRVGPDVADCWVSGRDSQILVNHTTPGAQNALRTSLHRLWLRPLVHTDPDVVYFRSIENHLTNRQKVLLRDLASIARFKATSDIPSWLTETERIELREYLEEYPEVAQVGRYSYKLGDRMVDFSAYIELPTPTRAEHALGRMVGGLANLPWVLKAFDKIGRDKLKKMLVRDPV